MRADFLARFGYLDTARARDPRAVADAILLYQRFYRLAPTGQLSLETIEHMRRPRCGNPDPVAAVGSDGTAEADPIVYFGERWSNRSLRFFIDHTTSDMTGEPGVIQDAFDKWSAVVPLSFARVFERKEADIVVSWEVGSHGDGSPFDGPGHILAHAFPPLGGPTRVHFDDAEDWGTDDDDGQTDLLSIAMHEIGHALGLDHSREEGAVMFATNDGEKRTLHELDIKGMRSRYPEIVDFGDAKAARLHLWGLKSGGGSGVRRAVFSKSRPLIAWAQRTMVDSLNDLDRDNAWAIEIIEVDEQRIDTRVSGGAHWGSSGSPNNVHQGAFCGTARSITFRISATHTADLDVFGVGCVMVL